MTSLHAEPVRLARSTPSRSRCEGRWWARARLGAVALWLPLACGESRDRPPLLGTARPIPGCQGFDYRPCDILTAGCQRELFALAACMHGDRDAGEAPPVRQLDEASAIALLEETSDSMGMSAGVDAMSDTAGADAMSDAAGDEAAFRAAVRGLELIGLLDAGTIEAPSDVVDATVEGLLAYYLVPTKEVIVIDRGEPVDDIDANGVLAHEFVHALQDRRHDLGSFGADFALDSDGELARSSLIEGEASVYQYLLMFAYAGRDVRSVNFRAFFEDLASVGLDVTLQAGSPALTAGSIFPYTFGTRYAGEHWMEGGSAAVDALYAAPPRSSWEVLGGDAAAEVAVFAEAPAPLDGYVASSDDIAGAWVSVAMLAGLEGASDVAGELPELASQWRGDHLWIYDSPDAGVATLWAIEWASADAAERFAELAASFMPAGATLRVDTAGSSTRVTAVERAEDMEAWRARLGEVVP
jgi:hypothetical protein